MFAYPLTEERFRAMVVETAARRSGRATLEAELPEHPLAPRSRPTPPIQEETRHAPPE
jgi:hypothetical protein